MNDQMLQSPGKCPVDVSRNQPVCFFKNPSQNSPLGLEPCPDSHPIPNIDHSPPHHPQALYKLALSILYPYFPTHSLPATPVSFCPTHQANSCLRGLALAVFLAWDSLPSHLLKTLQVFAQTSPLQRGLPDHPI